MAASYTFSSLPNINIPRTAMKVECTHPTSFNHGKIIPLFCIPVGPAENYKLYLNSLIRSHPIFPFYGDIKVFVHSFFVPMRLVWEHTAEFFGENVLSKGPQPQEYLIPAAKYGGLISTAYADKIMTNGNYKITGKQTTVSAGFDAPWLGSVSHYLMKPLPKEEYLNNGSNDPTYASKNIMVSVLKERGYWLIYNEYYRPQQLIDPIYVNKSDNGYIGQDPNRKNGNNLPANLTFATEVATCCKMFDYFRSATTSPIYSDGPVEIPITLNADLMPLVNDAVHPYDVDEFDYDNVPGPIYFGVGHSGISNSDQALVNHIDSAGDPLLGFGGVSVSSENVRYLYSGYDAEDPLPSLQTTLYADPRNSITGIAGDVDKLRYLFAQYNFLYRDNFGTRYPEIIQTHFNLKPSIAILQRPELLHEGSFPINVSQVLSTAGAADDDTTKLGQPGANSVTANRQLVVNKSIEEWGFIYVMIETKHKRVYTSGINAQDLRRTKFEHYFPEFALIGNKKIQVSELSVDIPVECDCKFDDAWAYQEAWAPERYFISKATGLLDVRAPSNLSYMSLAEDADPTDEIINADFVLENRDAIKRVLVSGDNGPDYTADFALTGVMAKPMPLYSEPGLIDHIGAW